MKKQGIEMDNVSDHALARAFREREAISRAEGLITHTGFCDAVNQLAREIETRNTFDALATSPAFTADGARQAFGDAAAQVEKAITEEWILGYLDTDLPERARIAVRDAFAEWNSLSDFAASPSPGLVSRPVDATAVVSSEQAVCETQGQDGAQAAAWMIRQRDTQEILLSGNLLWDNEGEAVDCADRMNDDEGEDCYEAVAVYTAPPSLGGGDWSALVPYPKPTVFSMEGFVTRDGWREKHAENRGWNACRQAMLATLPPPSVESEVATVTGFRKGGDRGPVLDWADGAAARIGMKLYTAPPTVPSPNAGSCRYEFIRENAIQVQWLSDKNGLVTVEDMDSDEDVRTELDQLIDGEIAFMNDFLKGRSSA